MKISTRARYGIRAVVYLATHYQQGPIARSQITRDQALSGKYLHNLFTLLRKDGILRTYRGKHGGFGLARHPSKIKMLDIFEALEGPIMLVHCLKRQKCCPGPAKCMTRFFWKDLGALISNFLANMSLADFVRIYKKKIK
jgi:Rrf2 family protein